MPARGWSCFKLCDHLPVAIGVPQEIAATPLANEKLKRLTRRRRALVEEKTRVLCRLQVDLQAVCPGLLAITKDAGNLWFLSFLSHQDELSKLSRLRESTILGIKGIGLTRRA